MSRLSFETLGAEADPSEVVLFLHGILGRGSNWRSAARRWVDARPGAVAVLVDLRLHGESLDVEGPHTLAACAEDLRALAAALPARPSTVVGHSFGGKVALAYAAARRDAGHPLERAWILDSLPGARPDRRGSEAIAEVMNALRAVPREHGSRGAFVKALTDQGLAKPIAQWLGMSVQRLDSGVRYPIDLDAIESLLADYFAADRWDDVGAAARTELVIGTRSPVFDDDARARAHALAAAEDGVQVHELDAGHWVHVEAPDALHALFTA